MRCIQSCLNCGQDLVQTEIPFGAGRRIGIHFRQSNAYRYEMQDHLGNVRAALVKTSPDGHLEQYRLCNIPGFS